jgi:hypothetical protein
MGDSPASGRGLSVAPERVGDWITAAAAEVRALGFVLRDGGEPGTSPGPRLIVALRAAPTLEHFDPEEATYWAFSDGRGSLRSLTAGVARACGLPLELSFSWGRIRVIDRVPVHNQFLAFGGTLRAGELADGTVVAMFASPAPILRWAGHSQGADAFVDEVGAFFARLMVPVDFQDGAEARIGACSPEGLFAAAMRHADARLHETRRLAEADPDLARVVGHEVRRLAAESPGAWREGEELLEFLELG